MWLGVANTVLVLLGLAGLAINLTICSLLLRLGRNNRSVFDNAALLLCGLYCITWPVRHADTLLLHCRLLPGNWRWSGYRL